MTNNIKEDIDFYHQLKKDNFTQRSIDLVEKYVEKHTAFRYIMAGNIYWVVKELCDQTSKLLKENTILRENIFNIEQQIPTEQQWETILASKLQRAINQQEYLEITNSIDNQTYIITIQKKYGKTPQQLLQEAEIRRSKAEEKNKNLLKEIEINKKRILEQTTSIRKLEQTKHSIFEPGGELKARQEIEHAIQYVKRQIEEFNGQFYRYNIPKLHQSVIGAMQEGFVRVSKLEFKIRKLNLDKEELLKKLNKKGVAKSKFGKYRFNK